MTVINHVFIPHCLCVKRPQKYDFCSDQWWRIALPPPLNFNGIYRGQLNRVKLKLSPWLSLALISFKTYIMQFSGSEQFLSINNSTWTFTACLKWDAKSISFGNTHHKYLIAHFPLKMLSYNLTVVFQYYKCTILGKYN